MTFLFTIKEQTKAHSRELKKTDRELVRDRQKLDAEEQRLVRADISINTYFYFYFCRLMKFERMQRLAIKRSTKTNQFQFNNFVFLGIRNLS